jgi:hypothetical protein
MFTKFTRILLFSAILFSFEKITAQIPNNGFESWEPDLFGNLNPTGWETTNEDPLISVEPYTPAKQGNYSMRVKAFDFGIFPLGGIAIASFPYTQRPSVFSGWVKATIMPGDAAYVIVSLWKGDSIIASPDSCTFIIESTISEFTQFSYTLAYQSSLIPDSAYVMVMAGKSGNITVGTEIILDELAFGQSVGFEENINAGTSSAGSVYPNPASGSIHIPLYLDRTTAGFDIGIYNAAGARISSSRYGSMEPGHHTIDLSVDGFSNGFYSYRISGNGFQHAGKFTVRK